MDDAEQPTFSTDLSAKSPLRHKIRNGVKAHPNIKNIVAVASGKGGVGKSTTTINLAAALVNLGLSVGVLDADIYGPSVTMMLGSSQRPASADGKTMTPLQKYGVHFNSMGAMVDPEQAMIWRGPVVSRTLMQLFDETDWPKLDLLLIDLPPGTGDIQLTLSQKIPMTGALVVTTPQDIALLDARRAFAMFKEVNVPTLGVIENMSMHTCSQCGHVEPIFGQGGGQAFAEAYDVPLLGQLPLSMSIREQADNGVPVVVHSPESDEAVAYFEMGLNVLEQLRQQPKEHGASLSQITINVQSTS